MSTSSHYGYAPDSRVSIYIFLILKVAISSVDFEENEVDFINLVTVMIRLLDSCGQYVTSKQSNMAHWHPVLGWFSSRLDTYLQESLGTVSCLKRLAIKKIYYATVGSKNRTHLGLILPTKKVRKISGIRIQFLIFWKKH